MIRRLRLWYPFLFALLPILNTLTRNPGGSRLDDVAAVIGVALVACAAVYGITAAVVRGRWSRALVPPLVLAVILLCYGKSAMGDLSRRVVGAPPVVVLVAALGIIALGIWWLARRPRTLDQVNTFFGVSGLLMVVWLGLRIAADQIRARSVIGRSTLARELSQPVRAKPPTSFLGAESSRDIYLIVLDEYANSEVLREQFQFDNRMFEDSLRQLGFTIPALVRSNYVHTLLSLPSLLNFSHLTSLTAEVGAHSTDASLPNHLMENNRTVAFLQERRYQFLFFPSQWWPSTSRNPHADWMFEPWSGFNLGREATRSDLRRSLLATTVFGLLKQDDAWDADYIERTLAALEHVPERPGPKFALAHIVSPHWPYVFEADCRIATQTPIKGPAHRREAYTGQLHCLNQLILHTVTTILQRSTPRPVILLQGDHGTNLLRYSDARSATAVAPAQARERFGAFGAYYVPDGGGGLFTDSVTLVNVFQKVLSYYFGADIAPAPDDLYMSLERTPYDFAKLDPASLRPLVTHSRSGT